MHRVRPHEVALEADAQAQDRQRHAAAAAILAAIRPGAEPAATEHRLILDVLAADPVVLLGLGRDREPLDPALATAIAHPVAESRDHVAAALHVSGDLGRVGDRAAGDRRAGRTAPRAGARTFAQLLDLDLRRRLGRTGALVDGDQHARVVDRHAHERRPLVAAHPAIVAEGADHDAGRVEDAEQAPIERHQMGGDLQLLDHLLPGLTGLTLGIWSLSHPANASFLL